MLNMFAGSIACTTLHTRIMVSLILGIGDIPFFFFGSFWSSRFGSSRFGFLFACSTGGLANVVGVLWAYYPRHRPQGPNSGDLNSHMCVQAFHSVLSSK